MHAFNRRTNIVATVTDMQCRMGFCFFKGHCRLANTTQTVFPQCVATVAKVSENGCQASNFMNFQPFQFTRWPFLTATKLVLPAIGARSQRNLASSPPPPVQRSIVYRTQCVRRKAGWEPGNKTTRQSESCLRMITAKKRSPSKFFSCGSMPSLCIAATRAQNLRAICDHYPTESTCSVVTIELLLFAKNCRDLGPKNGLRSNL